ncbi:SAP domain-containing protein [Advenella mimigardefordensis]|nr:SAP domain-containing protein [Advenella mimigardefordensis]
MSKLYQGMTQEEFDGGYFYATELKAFAKILGISANNLKKERTRTAY